MYCLVFPYKGRMHLYHGHDIVRIHCKILYLAAFIVIISACALDCSMRLFVGSRSADFRSTRTLPICIQPSIDDLNRNRTLSSTTQIEFCALSGSARRRGRARLTRRRIVHPCSGYKTIKRIQASTPTKIHTRIRKVPY